MVGAYRLILALMVLGSHSFNIWENYPDPGLIAVVTFFFISGFLMPATYEANYQYRSFGAQMTNFYWARFLRIYPMYWIALFIGIAIVPVVTGAPNWYDGGLLHAGIQNFVLLGLNQASFWSSETRVVNVAWTLDIELQFYLLVPVFMLLRRGTSVALYTIFAAISLYSVWRLAHPTGITGIDRSFLSYGVYFCLGFACYLNRDILQRQAKYLVTIIIVISLIVSVLTWRQFGAHDSEWPLSAGFAAVAMLLLVRRAEANRWDKYLGDLSYPVFLFHSSIQHCGIPDALTRGLAGAQWLSFLLAAVLSIAFAALVERIVSPTINRIRDRAKKREPSLKAYTEMAGASSI